MTFGISDTLRIMDDRLRNVERMLEKCELREKQLIVMFKMILDKYYGKKGRVNYIHLKDIIEFMEQLVNKNLAPEEVKERNVDLLSQDKPRLP